MKPLDNEVSIDIDQTYGRSLGIELVENTGLFDGKKRFSIGKILTGGLAFGRTDIKIGDEILAVNNFNVTSATLSEATNLLNSQDYSMICLQIKPENMSNKNGASSNNGSVINCSTSELQDSSDDDSGFFPPLPLSIPPPPPIQDGAEDVCLLPPPPPLLFNASVSGIHLPDDNGGDDEECNDDDDDFPLPPPLDMLSPKIPTIATSLPSLQTNYNAYSDESDGNQSEIQKDTSSNGDSVTLTKAILPTFNFLNSSNGFSNFASKLDDKGVEKGTTILAEKNLKYCDSNRNPSEFSNTLTTESNLFDESNKIFVDYKDSGIFSPTEVIQTSADSNPLVGEVFSDEEQSTLDGFHGTQLPTPSLEESPKENSTKNELNSNTIRDAFSAAKDILTKNETVSSVLRDYYVDAPKIETDISKSKQEQQPKAKKPIIAQALLPKSMRAITDLQATVSGAGGAGMNPALIELQDLINTGKNVKEVLSTPDICANYEKSKNKVTDTLSLGLKKNEDPVDQSGLPLEKKETIKTGVQEKRTTFGTRKSESLNVSGEYEMKTNLYKPAKKAAPPVHGKTFAKAPKVVGFSEDQIKHMLEIQKTKTVQHKDSDTGSSRSVSRSGASDADLDHDLKDNKYSFSHMDSQQLDGEVFKEESQIINNRDGSINDNKDEEFVHVKKKIQDSRRLFEAMSSNKIRDTQPDTGLSRSKSAASSFAKQPELKNVREKCVVTQNPQNIDASKVVSEEKHPKVKQASKNETGSVPVISSSVEESGDVPAENIRPISEKKAFYELMNSPKDQAPKPLPKKAFSFSAKNPSDPGISSYRNKLKSTGNLKNLTKTNVLPATADDGDGKNIITNVEKKVGEKGADGDDTNKPLMPGNMMPVGVLNSKFGTPTKKMPSSPSVNSCSVDEPNGYSLPTQEANRRPGKSIASIVSDSPKSAVWKSFLQNYSQK